MGVLEADQEKTMDGMYKSLNPAQLRREIGEALEKLWKLSEREKHADKSA